MSRGKGSCVFPIGSEMTGRHFVYKPGDSPRLEGGVAARINDSQNARRRGGGQRREATLDVARSASEFHKKRGASLFTTPSARVLGIVYARSHPSFEEGTTDLPVESTLGHAIEIIGAAG